MENKTVLILYNIRSLYNVGAIFRSADATGVNKIYLTGYSGVTKISGKYYLNPKLEKTALEGISVKWEYIENPLDIIDRLKTEKYQIISVEQSNNSQPYNQVKYSNQICLIVGNEVDGLPIKILEQSDMIAEIPMYGKGKSLNVGVATAVMLYQIKNG